MDKEVYLAMLKKSLEGIELTDDEERFIQWIAGWDIWTIQNLVHLFNKCRNFGD